MGFSAAVASLALLIAGAQAGFLLTQYPNSKTVANKLIVTWSPIPGGIGGLGFFEIPRKADDARKEGFLPYFDRTSIDYTVAYCKNDYRVCPMYDMQGSIAGLMVSASKDGFANAPYKIDSEPQWFKQRMSNTDIYSTITYFTDEKTRAAGGRKLGENDLTAPNGLYILQTKNNVNTTLHVPISESAAETARFTKQNCFLAMGQHYFQELSPSSDCDTSRNYFTLYGHETKTLHGYGVLMWGKQTEKGGRNWFEQPNRLAVEMIAGNRPDCLLDYVDDHTLNSLHVFFIPTPWMTSCSTLF